MKPSGRVGSRTALGADGIRLLVEQLSSSSSNNGAAVPSFDLPALSGGNLKATDLQGRETLLLFWDPGCGFCAAMLDALRRWDSSRSDDEPRLLVISTGGDEANRALLLSSSVVLDPSFALARSMGVGGTPSAVLVDQSGHVASDVAVGEPGIWRLLGVGADYFAAVDGTQSLSDKSRR
jgi:peroxiredoxin